MVERELTYMAKGETEKDRVGYQVRRILSHIRRGFQQATSRCFWYWCWKPECEGSRIMEPNVWKQLSLGLDVKGVLVYTRHRKCGSDDFYVFSLERYLRSPVTIKVQERQTDKSLTVINKNQFSGCGALSSISKCYFLSQSLGALDGYFSGWPRAAIDCG